MRSTKGGSLSFPEQAGINSNTLTKMHHSNSASRQRPKDECSLFTKRPYAGDYHAACFVAFHCTARATTTTVVELTELDMTDEKEPRVEHDQSNPIRVQVSEVCLLRSVVDYVVHSPPSSLRAWRTHKFQARQPSIPPPRCRDLGTEPAVVRVVLKNADKPTVVRSRLTRYTELPKKTMLRRGEVRNARGRCAMLPPFHTTMADNIGQNWLWS